MKNLKFTLFIAVLAFLSCTPKTVEQVVQTPAPTNVKIDTKFPEGWLGEWKGELKITKGSGVVQTLPMKMRIEATDLTGEYNWSTTFGDKAETNKPYRLKTLDKENGLYVMDEENSIKLETYLFENKLVSWYTVQGSLILASWERRGPNIVFEILGENNAIYSNAASFSV